MEVTFKQNQPTFSATFRIDGIKRNKKKADAVGEIFSRATSHYKDDSFVVRREVAKDKKTNKLFNFISFAQDEADTFAYIDNYKGFKQYFEETPAENIAKDMAKLYKTAKARDKVCGEFYDAFTAEETKFTEAQKILSKTAQNLNNFYLSTFAAVSEELRLPIMRNVHDRMRPTYAARYEKVANKINQDNKLYQILDCFDHDVSVM